MSDAPPATSPQGGSAPAPSTAPPLVPPHPGSPPPVAGMPGRQSPGQPVFAPGWELGPQGWQRAPFVPRPRAAVPPSALMRYWPGPGPVPAPRVALSLVVVAAVVAAISLVFTTPGFGWLLTATAMAAVAVFTGMARKPAATPVPAVAGVDVDVPAASDPALQVAAAESAETEAEATDAADTETETTDADVSDPEAPEIEPEAVATPATPTADVAVSLTRRLSPRVHGERIFWSLCALALVSVGTFRAAGWLYFWCVIFAFGCSALALAGGRTVQAMFLSGLTLPSSIFRSPAWVVRGVSALRNRDGGPRIVISVAISVVLLVVFGGLFAGADAEFAHVLGSLLPPLRATEVVRAIFCFFVVAAVACGVAFLAAARPKLGDLAPSTPRRVRRVEWVLPLAVLNVLFAVFVFIQLTVLFGNDSKLLNASHKYMRGYAHSGFWQLLVVTILTLTVLGISGRVAPRETKSDRTLLRVLLGGLTVFSIVVVLSALKRVYAYEHAYGFTRLRVVVAGVEVWFGVLFVLVLIAGISLKTNWLPRVIVASLALSLLTGAIVNPDRYVAQQNVNRYEQTGKLSLYYMRQMSPDAVPAIEQLPPTLRTCALQDIANDLADNPDDWRTWNFARHDARHAIGTFVEPTYDNCPDLVR